MMKKQQQLVVLLLLILLIMLLSVHNVKASRTAKTGKDAARIDEFPQYLVDHSLETARENNTSDMMGTLDRCDDGDGECLERRMMSEVHLDYIYTQHQEP